MSDTKELQKEINNLTGKLDRTFAVTDELVFKVRRSVLCPTLAVNHKRCQHHPCGRIYADWGIVWSGS